MMEEWVIKIKINQLIPDDGIIRRITKFPTGMNQLDTVEVLESAEDAGQEKDEVVIALELFIHGTGRDSIFAIVKMPVNNLEERTAMECGDNVIMLVCPTKKGRELECIPAVAVGRYARKHAKPDHKHECDHTHDWPVPAHLRRN